MIRLEQHREGVILTVKAQAGGRRDAIQGVHDGALKVSVTQVAEKGKANLAISGLLEKSLALKRSQLTLISGQSGTLKRFLVRNIELGELQAKLDSALAYRPG